MFTLTDYAMKKSGKLYGQSPIIFYNLFVFGLNSD
jgi:hypothetical protein